MVWWVASTVSASLLAGLALLLWLRRPPAPLWPVVFACQISALCWVVGDLWATHATTLPEKQLALTVLFTGAVSVATLWWTTARRYVAAHGLGRPWMERRSVRFGPAVFVGAAWLFAVTNPWHGQMMTPVVGGPNEHHWGSVLLANLNYAIVVATFVLCVWAMRRHTSPDVSRRMAILAVATLAPLVTSLLHVYLRLGARTDEVAIGLGIGSAAILYGIYRQRLFNPLPIALPEVLDRDPVGVLLLGSRGRLLYWNPAAARMLKGMGLEPDMELVPALAERLVSMDDTPPPLWRALSRIGAEQEPRVYRYQGEGEVRWLRLSVAPLSTRRKRVAALCLRLEDVTELQRVERQRRQLARRIRQLEKLESLGVMAGGVAHDFNNLLTAIGGFANLTLEQLPDDEGLRENLQMILQATDLAADLTRELLSSAGRSHMTKGPVVLSDLVAETIALLRGSLPKAVGVQVDLPS
ncbi:MAG: histidine kinase N-terminal 7TM domain-containing protein, partial [Myxococcota bacterium]